MAFLRRKQRHCAWRRVTIVPAVSAALVFGASATTAQVSHDSSATAGAGEDEITLENGGMLRGTIVAEEPGKGVVIRIQGSNEDRTVLWIEVQKVERGKHVRKDPAPSPAPGTNAGAAPCDAPDLADALPRDKGVVRIHLETAPSARQVRLYRWLGQTSWLDSRFDIGLLGKAVQSTGSQEFGPRFGEPVCTAPCDKTVDGRKGHAFLLSGYGVTDSAPFQLLDWQGDVTLRVAPGNALAHIWGFNIGAYIGLPSVLAGGGVLLAGELLFAGLNDVDVAPPKPLFVFRAVGLSLLALGVAITIPNFVLYATNRTTYEVVNGKPPAKRPRSSSTSGRFLPRF
jgi:hypothetical protein